MKPEKRRLTAPFLPAVFFPVAFHENCGDILYRLIGMSRDMKLAERAGCDNNLSAGFLDLLPAFLAQRRRFVRVARPDAAAAATADCRHLH